jgi:hypothetical protein
MIYFCSWLRRSNGAPCLGRCGTVSGLLSHAALLSDRALMTSQVLFALAKGLEKLTELSERYDPGWRSMMAYVEAVNHLSSEEP